MAQKRKRQTAEHANTEQTNTRPESREREPKKPYGIAKNPRPGHPTAQDPKRKAPTHNRETVRLEPRRQSAAIAAAAQEATN